MRGSTWPHPCCPAPSCCIQSCICMETVDSMQQSNILLSAFSGQGVFGTSVGEGVQHKLRLLRTSAPLSRPDCHLLPMPRGSLADLKLVPLDPAQPGQGQIKVHNLPNSFSCFGALSSLLCFDQGSLQLLCCQVLFLICHVAFTGPCAFL